MAELHIGPVVEGELNFDHSFLQFNPNKNVYAKSSSWFDFKCWILDSASLSSQFIAVIMSVSQ